MAINSQKPEIDILSYFKTIGMTLLIAMVFSGVIIYFAQLDVINHASSQYDDRRLKDYIKKTVILQNEDLESEYPDDYRIDIHLGYLNKVVEDYTKAEMYYQRAIEKAPYNCYQPYYEMASLYVVMKRYDEAEDIMNRLPEKPNKALIKYKSQIFKAIGDEYFNLGKWDIALKKYDKVLYYQDKLPMPQSGVIEYINSQKFICDINLADIYVNEDKMDMAVKLLKAAEHFAPDNFTLQYKLALAQTTTNPLESYNYFKKLFDEDPSKINYLAYYNLIDAISEMYYEQGDSVNGDLYDFKAKQLLDFVETKIIYPNDVIFKISDKKLYSINRRSKILLTLNIQNCATIPIKSLSADVTYKKGKKVIETYTKKIITKENELATGNTIPEITVMPKKFTMIKKKNVPKLNVEVYLYKSDKNRICVYSGKVFDTIKKQ